MQFHLKKTLKSNSLFYIKFITFLKNQMENSMIGENHLIFQSKTELVSPTNNSQNIIPEGKNKILSSKSKDMTHKKILVEM